MAKQGKQNAVAEQSKEQPRCVSVSDKGITTSRDLRNTLSALMSDLAAGRVTSGAGNAMCNAAGKLLKTAELEQKYGTAQGGNGGKVISIADEAAVGQRRLASGE